MKQTPSTLLEISTRPYLYYLSQKLNKTISKISQIPEKEFDDWKSKGYKWIWFMGIWQLGEYGLNHDRTDPSLKKAFDDVLPGWNEDDVIGSPYAVVSYTINKDIVNDDNDIIWLRKQLHLRGMKLMVDFVPNHSAIDAPEVDSKPSFYIRAPKGSEGPDNGKYFTKNGISIAYGCGMWCAPWTDVAQFNYFDTEFRKNRISILKCIASIADGIRCDMAHLILNQTFWDYWKENLESWGYKMPTTEFWSDAIKAIKLEYPDFVFMAEAYGDVNDKLLECGYDYTYNKGLYDFIRDNRYDDFKNFIFHYGRSPEYFNKMVHFTENHDEERSIHVYGSIEKANAAAAALFTLPGLRFFNMGQSEGFARKIDVHLRRAVSEKPNPDVISFYSKLYNIIQKDVLINGNFEPLPFKGSFEIVAWKWTKGESRILVCVNLSDHQCGGNVVLNDAPLKSKTIPVTDLIGGDVYDRDPNEMRTTGLIVVLQSYQIQIFEY